MAKEKSTNDQERNTVEEKRPHFLPDYGLVVQAADPKEAEEVARKQVTNEDKSKWDATPAH